jgi:hypothetical protein
MNLTVNKRSSEAFVGQLLEGGTPQSKGVHAANLSLLICPRLPRAGRRGQI